MSWKLSYLGRILHFGLWQAFVWYIISQSNYSFIWMSSIPISIYRPASAIDAIVASNIVFWLVLDPCFEWAGSARVDGRGPGGGAGRGAADAPQEAAARHRGAAPARPGPPPDYWPAHARVGGCWVATRSRPRAGTIKTLNPVYILISPYRWPSPRICDES